MSPDTHQQRLRWRFVLLRHADVTGVSGTGVVAEGVVFSDGAVAVRWPSDTPCTSTWDDVNHVRMIHGHNGRSVVRWLDGVDRIGEN